jgi:hypothetical protein
LKIEIKDNGAGADVSYVDIVPVCSGKVLFCQISVDDKRPNWDDHGSDDGDVSTFEIIFTKRYDKDSDDLKYTSVSIIPETEDEKAFFRNAWLLRMQESHDAYFYIVPKPTDTERENSLFVRFDDGKELQTTR